MNVTELLSKLRRSEVKIWAENGQLFCNAPKGALAAELRAEISERKAEILAFLRDASATARSVEPPMQPSPRDEELPLSFAQERLWLLDQLEPGRSAYHMSSTVRLIGPLNTAALEQSLAEIVRRHETLRTTFTTVEDRPVQVIAPSSDAAGVDLFRLIVVDLRHLGESQRRVEALRLAGEEIRRPFDLTNDLMIRAGLFRLGAEEHVLFLALHHIASDGWSMGILYRELSVLYEAFSNGRASPMPELPIQYADFAQWQRKRLQGGMLEAQVAYWKRQLRDLPTLELPSDRPRPAVQTYRGRRQTARVGEGVADALKAFSRLEGASLFMTLLAAFQILLYRYTGQEDIVVGTPIAGRNRVEIEELIGFFINTLVLRTNVSGDCTFRELLGGVREVTLGAYAHQDLPFEKLLEELRPERDLSRTPLFQIFFNMVNVGEISLKLSGLKAEPLSAANVESKFDMTVYVREQEQGLQFNLVYNADLFNQDRMAEMLRQYERLLSQIAQNPDQAISSFSLVTPAAMNLLPDPTEPLDMNWVGAVHDRLSDQAKRTPEHPAITDPYDSWTYRELNLRSNQLARSLVESGVERGDVVAIYGHRSASLVWAVLGILKAGAAFLILDPAYPLARSIHYMRLAKPRGFVRLDVLDAVSDELEEFIKENTAYQVTLPRLSGLRFNDPLQSYSTEEPGIPVGPDDLAYVSFTSGSTGEAKGVLGRHGSLSHFLPWQAETFGLNASDRFSMLSGLAHDPLQRDIFTPLWVGATLCIPDPEIIGTSKLAQWMAETQVTFAHLTPALAELLAESAASNRRLPSLRYVFFVGDKLTRRDVARLRRLAPGVTCIASYGTTETQRAVGFNLISEKTEPRERRHREVYPLGRGIKDVQLLVLTAGQRLAGIGELGEIYVRSPHLALRYLDEELTRERFLTNPFTSIPGDRLYKTGDLGRYLPDGDVEFAGRADRQIKIRGFRVEPEEIEAALSRHVSLQKAVVLLKEDRTGQKQLVAYLVPAVEHPPPAGELRRFLKSRLPHYMIPTAFIYVAALPLTPNGKLDAQALSAPDRESLDQERCFVAAESETERTIARIWQDVLHTSQVRVDDSFFDLGGHSLLAVRVISRLRQALHVEIPLRVFFENPTVANLAAKVDQFRENGAGVEVAEILDDLESLSDDEAQELLQERYKS
ncbi:MAG: amino acid adenylation domain-containing protein [Candidatus Binatia bacterium]